MAHGDVDNVGVIALLSGATGEAIWCEGPPYETAWESSFGRFLAAGSTGRAAYVSGAAPGKGGLVIYRYTWLDGAPEVSPFWEVPGGEEADGLMMAVGEARVWLLMDEGKASEVRSASLADSRR
jgi:hypothetical protein